MKIEVTVARSERPATYRHGTRYWYTQGCRCDLCREAHRVYTYARVEYRRQNITPKVHNASTYKNYKCRCEVCTEANKEHCRQYKQRKST